MNRMKGSIVGGINKRRPVRLALLGLVCVAVLLPACSSSLSSGNIPELSDSVVIRASITKAERGNVERVEQLVGAIRYRSDELSYGPTNLRFGGYLVMPGDRVVKGQVLATLDTELIEQQIETQSAAIDQLVSGYEHDNESAEIDISILQAELAGLNAAAAPTGEPADNTDAVRNMASAKTQEISRARLALEQQRERQELTLQNAEEQLGVLEQQLYNAAIRAPYDGVITWVADKSQGSFIVPYAGLVYISNESEKFIELVKPKLMTDVLRYDLVIANIGENAYELKWIKPSDQEWLYYVANKLVPPARFNIIDADSGAAAGTYVRVMFYYVYAEDVLRVPLNCVYTDTSEGSYVYIMENGKKAMRPVELGRRGDIFIEIVSGLVEGDEVYVKS